MTEPPSQAVARAKHPSQHSFFVKEPGVKSALRVRDKVLMECTSDSEFGRSRP